MSLLQNYDKTFYVRSGALNVNPTQSIHAEIEIIAFGDHTENPSVSLVFGYNLLQYGFRVDEFVCNTLK